MAGYFRKIFTMLVLDASLAGCTKETAEKSTEQPGEDGDTVSTAACGPEPFTVLAKEEREIPYVPLGRWITIELTGDKQPDEAVLSDYILKEDGNPRYDEKTVITTQLEFDNHEMRFCLAPNVNAMLSSDMSAYMTGGILRGFKLELV